MSDPANTTGATPVQAPAATQMNPGDEVPPGSSQSAENICPACGGRGSRDGKACETCGGTGRVVEIVGDA